MTEESLVRLASRSPSLKKRLLDKCIPEPMSGCWLWEAACLKDRYGNDSYGVIGVSGSRTMLAHRASYIVHAGPIPAGKCLLHRCDNRLCVNPGHLRPGSYAENNADMAKKGRACSGERRSQIVKRAIHRNEDVRARLMASRPRCDKHYKAKLSWEIVDEIRASVEKTSVLAERYGVVPSTIRYVRKGTKWLRL